MPEQEPFCAWSNFEFVADDGSINEVDLLVVSLYKIYLVEIKSRPGRVAGDVGTWTWNHAGRVYTDDNPLLLTNRKAKKLKALLQRQKALLLARSCNACATPMWSNSMPRPPSAGMRRCSWRWLVWS